ncbi:hypothetical protein [Sinobacterium caligoides]|nr:hypothetical protein [Sinobacterium caligoides]
MKQLITVLTLSVLGLLALSVSAEDLIYEQAQVEVVGHDEAAGQMTLRFRFSECYGPGCTIEGAIVTPATLVKMQQAAGDIEVLPSRYLHWQSFVADVVVTNDQTHVLMLKRYL